LFKRLKIVKLKAEKERGINGDAYIWGLLLRIKCFSKYIKKKYNMLKRRIGLV
jgi:hypothetical protein